MTEEKESKEWVDIPFGPPPKEYSYRCSRCGYRVGINEVIIDTAIGVAKFNGDYFDGFMPILNCLACNQETMEYCRD